MPTINFRFTVEFSGWVFSARRLTKKRRALFTTRAPSAFQAQDNVRKRVMRHPELRRLVYPTYRVYCGE